MVIYWQIQKNILEKLDFKTVDEHGRLAIKQELGRNVKRT